MKNEITVDGILYIPKTEAKPVIGEQYCMVRTYSAGVFCGWIDPAKTNNKRNTVRKAKRIHKWEKSASLSELAMSGTGNPGSCRVPEAVDIVYLEEIIEVIPMTDKAIITIKSIPLWTKI